MRAAGPSAGRMTTALKMRRSGRVGVRAGRFPLDPGATGSRIGGSRASRRNAVLTRIYLRPRPFRAVRVLRGWSDDSLTTTMTTTTAPATPTTRPFSSNLPAQGLRLFLAVWGSGVRVPLAPQNRYLSNPEHETNRVNFPPRRWSRLGFSCGCRSLLFLQAPVYVKERGSATTSSGWKFATIRRIPSRQSTLVPPTSSCIRVKSTGPPRSACPLSWNAGTRPTNEPR